jgi:hypothetical protein
MARRHRDVDPRGVVKVTVAIVVSLAILGGGVMQLTKFQDGARAGMYHSMDTRIKAAVGESAYLDNVQAVSAAEVAIPIIQRNLANATAANQTDKAADLQKALEDAQKAHDTAVGNIVTLGPNHQLYTSQLSADIAAQDDDAIRQDLATALPGLGSTTTSDYKGHATADTANALAIKDKSIHDMQRVMLIFVWPSLAGAFFAPLAFVGGTILKRAFVPSDTVGFKPYPGGAAGFFLLFGAFGLPSIPFAAWVFLDMEQRSVEGQIAL